MLVPDSATRSSGITAYPYRTGEGVTVYTENNSKKIGATQQFNIYLRHIPKTKMETHYL